MKRLIKQSPRRCSYGEGEHRLDSGEEKPLAHWVLVKRAYAIVPGETGGMLLHRHPVTLFNYCKTSSEWKLESSQGAGGANDACNSRNPGDDGGYNAEPATDMHKDEVIAC